ncbi:cytochrome c-type biogenesis protein CcmH [Gemmatimonas aurantiaca]|uniref:cytochrome c-type biogenesis protein CcmH n=1 Tax=Gemmatimonas aurantiaca TaxID=173480 RepID=UPI00301E39D9
MKGDQHRPADLSAPTSRRLFLVRSSGVVAGMTSALAISAGPARALQATQAAQAEMSTDAYRPVVRPPKPNATPSMDVKQVDAFERQLACPCPCTLDVYMCRTTMFSCGISPRVHGDVQRLVDGGYTADEIMAAMMETYGDFILMAPRKQGFNLLAWFAPFGAIALGAIAIGALLRRWRLNAVQADARVASRAAANGVAIADAEDLGATPEELARLQAALREER